MGPPPMITKVAVGGEWNGGKSVDSRSDGVRSHSDQNLLRAHPLLAALEDMAIHEGDWPQQNVHAFGPERSKAMQGGSPDPDFA